jgi:hypothetical protein
MDLALKDRRVLITGGSQGLGKAIARGFLAEGARVVSCHAIRTGCKKRWSSFASLGPVEGKAVDLSQRGAPEAVADAFRDVDILINNAGAIPTGDISAWTRRAGGKAWDLKVFGYINLMRAIYPHMRGKPPKVIVNVLGLGGEKPQWHYVCGNAANVALMGVTKSLGGRQHRRRHSGRRRQSRRRGDRANGQDPTRACATRVRRCRTMARVFQGQAAQPRRHARGSGERGAVPRLRPRQLGQRHGRAGGRRLSPSGELVFSRGVPTAPFPPSSVDTAASIAAAIESKRRSASCSPISMSPTGARRRDDTESKSSIDRGNLRPTDCAGREN